MCKIGPPGETGAATGCIPVTHARWPLQAMGYDAHFYEPATGGHSYGQDHALWCSGWAKTTRIFMEPEPER
jgi:hypothetical protein